MCKALRALANVVGQRIRRREDPRFLRGEGRYVDDLQLPGALHATFVRSYLAHAKITGIDKSAAEATGALVFTAADTDLGAEPAPPMLPVGPELYRPFSPATRSRFVGDIVAVVLADTRDASVDAAEMVRGRLRPVAGGSRPDRGGEGRGAAVPGGGHEHLLPPARRMTPIRTSSSRRHVRRERPPDQPADLGPAQSSRAPRPPRSARTGG